MQEKRAVTYSDRKLFLVIGITATLIIAFTAWWQWMNAMPEAKIPTPKMPSPNAYDFYAKASAAIIPANPAVDAIYDTQFVPESQWKTRYPTAKKESWLRQNKKALELIREGFKYPCRMPPERLKQQQIPSREFRDLARMLVIEGHARSELGNWAEAANSTLDVLRLGHDIGQGADVIKSLVGAAINAIGRNELWKILPHLNASEAKSTTARLEKIIEKRVSLAEVMREEKHQGQAQLLKQMRSTGWGTQNAKGSQAWDIPIQLWFSLTMTRRKVFDNHTRLMDAHIAAAEKPYARKDEVQIPKDTISQILTPVYSRSRWSYARDEAGNALLLVALALRSHKLEHNRYPQTLDELVPRYLKKVPADPFGGGESLRYKLSGAKYSLYSIGADGVDDNGRAIENTTIARAKRSRFLMKLESKGDMVAGINY